MFDQHSSPEKEGKYSVPLITIAVSAGLLLLSLGLCGLGSASEKMGAFTGLGVAAFLLSILGLVSGVLMLIVAAFRS